MSHVWSLGRGAASRCCAHRVAHRSPHDTPFEEHTQSIEVGYQRLISVKWALLDEDLNWRLGWKMVCNAATGTLSLALGGHRMLFVRSPGVALLW